MSSIGPKLQETRLKKGLTLERISDDTNIAMRFLSKIEGDDFTDFPGEPYIVGFIRNYAEYLGLDPEALVTAYRNKIDTVAEIVPEVVAEAPSPTPGKKPSRAKSHPKVSTTKPAADPAAVQPSPEATVPKVEGEEALTEEDAKALRKSRRRGFPKPAAHQFGRLGAAFAILIVAAAAFWIIAGGILSSPKIRQNPKAPVEYRIEGGPFEKRLYVGDSLLVPLGEEVYKITLADVSERVELDTPFGRQSLKLGESGVLDPDSDGIAEASLSIVDFEKRKAASGALVNISFPVQAAAAGPAGDVTISGKAPGLLPEATTDKAKAKPDTTVIFRSGRGPYPFVVQVSFRGSCLFRYEADRKEWVEKYYSKGESATINVNSALIVWTSNAQAAKLSFPSAGGKLIDLELGAPGEIAVKRIFWDSVEGSSALVASSLD
jgi:cytoskeleton protein RodZ